MTSPTDLPVGARLGPTHDECTSAMLAHVLCTFAGFVAPLVIYFAKGRQSRFVAFHSLQAIFWHLSLMITMAGSFIVFAATMFATGRFRGPVPSAGAHSGPPAVFFLGFFAIWGLMMLSWFVNMGFTIYVGVQSNAGRWTRYPIIGGLVARLFAFAEASTTP